MDENYDVVNSIFNEFPDFLKNKNVYDAMVTSVNHSKPRGYTFTQLLKYFIQDVIQKNNITFDDFYNQRKGKKLKAIVYVRTYFVMFLKEKGYTLPEISKMLNISWHIVRRCYLDFDLYMDDERFEIGYNEFVILSRKYF